MTVEERRQIMLKPVGPMRRTLLILVLTVLVWSGIQPHDRFTWFLEVAPVLLGIPIVLLTAKRFPLTPLTCEIGRASCRERV